MGIFNIEDSLFVSLAFDTLGLVFNAFGLHFGVQNLPKLSQRGIQKPCEGAMMAKRNDFENCCLVKNGHIERGLCPRKALCPNRELFPEGTHPQHPENCENYLKLPKHLNPIVNNQTHLIADEDKVTYPRWEKPKQ